MKKFFSVKVLLLLMAFMCNSQSFAQQKDLAIDLISVDEYQKVLELGPKQGLVVNFWATWCAPCLKEIPLLLEISKKTKTKVIFVSLDRQKDKARVEQVLTKNKVQGKHFLLIADDSDLSNILKDWYGAVPLTLIYNEENKLKAALRRALYRKDIETLKF